MCNSVYLCQTHDPQRHVYREIEIRVKADTVATKTSEEEMRKSKMLSKSSTGKQTHQLNRKAMTVQENSREVTTLHLESTTCKQRKCLWTLRKKKRSWARIN